MRALDSIWKVSGMRMRENPYVPAHASRLARARDNPSDKPCFERVLYSHDFHIRRGAADFPSMENARKTKPRISRVQEYAIAYAAFGESAGAQNDNVRLFKRRCV